MSTIQRCLVIPAAVIAMIAMASDAAAQCNTCSTGFGYPSDSAGCSSCAGGALGGALGHLREGIHTYKADSRLNRARNSAWPLPFSCWEREHVNAIFNQQFATGTQIAHTLTSEYFNAETNELNRAGEMRVAWIMQNAPQSDKQIYIYEDQTGPTMDQRLASVRQFTNRYYAHLGNAAVAKSQIKPHQIPSSYQEGYLRQYADAQPDPIIPVEVGVELNSTVGQ